jgi:hypothetical protein
MSERSPQIAGSDAPSGLGGWPATLDVPEAARLLGIGRTAAYELIRTGEWPTPVLRLGRRVIVPTVPLLALLGLTPRPAPADPGGDAA